MSAIKGDSLFLIYGNYTKGWPSLSGEYYKPLQPSSGRPRGVQGELRKAVSSLENGGRQRSLLEDCGDDEKTGDSSEEVVEEQKDVRRLSWMDELTSERGAI